ERRGAIRATRSERGRTELAGGACEPPEPVRSCREDRFPHAVDEEGACRHIGVMEGAVSQERFDAAPLAARRDSRPEGTSSLVVLRPSSPRLPQDRAGGPHRTSGSYP